ncbi:hypothetical protein GCM10010136_32450 [Limoniibacter endophyticus]|uniref:Uncharacterized protein n=1 Tax=Limoniibacter endophyticus TaxID=1565040 RepID=A0A8J3DLK3_9HYPH|nr:hypothetical protein GCM10010136_32450 [Limoniibacter endophyticus]
MRDRFQGWLGSGDGARRGRFVTLKAVTAKGRNAILAISINGFQDAMNRVGELMN